MVGPGLRGPDPSLAERIADLVDATVPAAVRDAVAVRVAVDAAADRDGGPLADLVADVLAGRGRPVARVRSTDYLFRRSVRLEFGPDDVDAAYERRVDWATLLREVLEPLAEPGHARWLPRLRDPTNDRPAREPIRRAAPGTAVLVDGPHLLRWELAGGFDLSVHLDVSPAALPRRFPEPGDPRPAAWARYLAECDPTGRADLVVRYDHPDRPWVTAG